MIIKLTMRSPDSFEIPVAYHSSLQGVIYHLLADYEDYSTFLHDEGYGEYGNRFRGFCFGSLRGDHVYHPRTKTITFDSLFTWEIRSPDMYFGDALLNALFQRDHLMIAGRRVNLVSCEEMSVDIQKNRVRIRMQSPVVVYQTLEKDGKKYTKYYNPLDDEFDDLIVGNFRKKYEALYGMPPESDIRLTALRIGKHDKVPTRFRKSPITGWNGLYRLEGTPDQIRFLYETGLGSKNSSGFGMFDII